MARWRDNWPAILAVLAVVAYVAWLPERWEYDSLVVLHGTQELLRWMRHGGELMPIGAFPPMQYLITLPVAALVEAGVPIPIFGFWSLLSGLSLAGAAVVVFRAAGGGHGGWAAILVLICGPLLAYSTSTYNELPAAVLIGLFALAAITRGGAGWCAVLFFAAAMSKEIAAPLLAPIWLAGIWMRRTELGRRGVGLHVLSLLIGLAAALVAHGAFNWLRYGTFLNRDYLADGMIVADMARRAEFFCALWLAPNGGVLAFWPLYGVVLVVAAAGFGRDRSSRIPTLAAAAVLFGLTAGLSAWLDPFGWACWGPRLMLPWLAGVMVLLLRVHRDAWSRAIATMLRPPARAAAVAAAMIALALPHALAPMDMTAVPMFFPDEPIDRLTRQPAHLARTSRLAWRQTPLLLPTPLRQLAGVPAAARAAVFAGAIGLVVLHARRLAHGAVAQ